MVHRILLSLALAFGAIFGIAANPQPAEAASYSWIWRKSGGSVPLYYAPTTKVNVKAWMPSNSKFWMVCWVEGQYWVGNYASRKWFFGQHQSGYYGYVHSSYVYYQKSVPRC